MKKLASIVFTFFALLSGAIPASAQSPVEKSYLNLYFTEDELKVVSATRSLKSIDRVAENMTVVTHDEIELMNAHTLADVISAVNGVAVYMAGASPGNVGVGYIQGSESRHVAVFLDGVPLNNLSNNLTVLDIVPAQLIEKIEVIKGPASSSWGSSLGGVINVISKEGADRLGGTLSASYGERSTSDLRAEISGRKENLGFYVSAGRLETDGFRRNNDVLNNNLFTRLSFDPNSTTRILFSLLYGDTMRGEYADPDINESGRRQHRHLMMNLSLNTALSSVADLSLALWSYDLQEKTFFYLLSDGSLLDSEIMRDRKYGASGKFTWRNENHAVVAGLEYEKGTSWNELYEGGKPSLEKWAGYVNDTITLGRFSVTPGLRYDDISSGGGFFSPSLGLTYDLGNKTLLRAFVARGFSTPPMTFVFLKEFFGWRGNPALKPETVMSYQLGMETGLLEHLWLKLSAFRHDISDGIVPEEVSPGIMSFINKQKLQRQGIELELKTVPFHNLTLHAGATLFEIKDGVTGEVIRNAPKATYVVGLEYNDKKTLRALLQGRYVWFDSEEGHLAKYSSMIVDLNVVKTVHEGNSGKIELFLAGHNLFNGNQYWDYWYKNAQRWVEAGVRYKF